MNTPAVEIHLRIRCERRDELLAFLAEAVPFYEAPGGIRVRLIELDNDEIPLARRRSLQRVCESLQLADISLARSAWKASTASSGFIWTSRPLGAS